MATYQSVTEKDRIDVRPHLECAAETLRAAEVLVREGLPGDAVTRAHQACVHAERALLATEKRSPPDVRSVHRMATLHFLQNDRLPPQGLAAVEHLWELRCRVDDLPLARVAPDEAEQALAAARSFVADVRAHLAAEGHATDAPAAGEA